MKIKNADQIQAEIYRKMPSKKKAEVWSAFYKAGKFLNSLENDRRRSNKSSHQNRQNS